jgi:hypothetical protein
MEMIFQLEKEKKRIAGCNPADAYSPMTQRLTID